MTAAAQRIFPILCMHRIVDCGARMFRADNTGALDA
jgi:hypothetical protein